MKLENSIKEILWTFINSFVEECIFQFNMSKEYFKCFLEFLYSKSKMNIPDIPISSILNAGIENHISDFVNSYVIRMLLEYIANSTYEILFDTYIDEFNDNRKTIHRRTVGMGNYNLGDKIDQKTFKVSQSFSFIKLWFTVIFLS